MKHAQEMFLFCLAALLIGGCSSGKIYNLKIPSGAQELRTKKALLIMPDGGNDALSGGLRAKVMKNRFHTLSTPETASEADYRVVGKLAKPNYTIERSQERQEVPRRCKKRNKEKKCISWQPASSYMLYQVKERCEARSTLLVEDLKTGGLVNEKTFRGVARASDVEKDAAAKEKGAALCQEAFKKMVPKAAGFLTPHNASVRISLESVPGTAHQRALKALEMGNLEKAIAQVENSVVSPGMSESDRAWARYNLAVLLQVAGDDQKCIESVEIAASELGAKSELTALSRRCRGEEVEEDKKEDGGGSFLNRLIRIRIE